ncbi:MAG: RNA-guided endonuclease InsQ/TnpB family protein [Nitrososphaerales archaeon]
MTTAIKSVKQTIVPSSEVLQLMETFRKMVNHCLKVGLQYNVSSMRALSRLSYMLLAKYDIVSYYKLCAISRAAGMLANRKKSIGRGLQPRHPYARRPLLASCYGFKIDDGTLKVPLGDRQYLEIPLNVYTLKALSGENVRIRSFTLSADNTVSICYSKEVTEIDCTGIMGIDRNLRNITVGNSKEVVQYDLSKTIDIAENTRSIMKSFKRNDVRIRIALYRKYGMRRKRRVNQMLHRLTKAIVQHAKQNKSSIAFEDIRHIRRLYKKGNYQGRAYRGRLNGWSFAEVKRQIEYKAAWEGLPVAQLSVKETRGTSQLCPRCGKKVTQVDRLTRQLWCAGCKKWMDRDVVAAMNLSIKGLARFASSKGLAGEAMKGNPTMPAILRVDASKLTFRSKQKG